MVSAISRLLTNDGWLAGFWSTLFRRHRPVALVHIDDLPDDLLIDVGLEGKGRSFDPRTDVWRRRGGVGDYLRPGPM